MRGQNGPLQTKPNSLGPIATIRKRMETAEDQGLNKSPMESYFVIPPHPYKATAIFYIIFLTLLFILYGL